MKKIFVCFLLLMGIVSVFPSLALSQELKLDTVIMNRRDSTTIKDEVYIRIINEKFIHLSRNLNGVNDGYEVLFPLMTLNVIQRQHPNSGGYDKGSIVFYSNLVHVEFVVSFPDTESTALAFDQVLSFIAENTD